MWTAPTVAALILGLTFIVATTISCEAFTASPRTVDYPQLAKVTTIVMEAHTEIFPNEVNEDILDLSTGVAAQVLFSLPQETKRPPIVFIHGSFHAAWCWTENYFPYFVSLGHPVVALSLRGTGGTFAGPGVQKVKINEHAQDLQSLLNQLSNVLGEEASKPILISHSFGGLAVMKYLEMFPKEVSQLSGIITLCSVPPSGNGRMTMRYLKKSLVASWKITAGFAMKKCIKNEKLCRELFFGGDKVILENGTVEDYGVSDEDIGRYQDNFLRDTDATIDINDLVNHLPSKLAVEGKAPFVSDLPPCLVVGAERDFIVDSEGVRETATYFGLEAPLLIDSPHDVMLGRNWQKGADAIHDWVENMQV